MPRESGQESRGCRLRRRLGLVLGPGGLLLLMLLPAPEGLSAQGMAVASVALLMAIWWICEAVPIGATALLPLALFPLFGAMDGAATAANYGNHLIFLFLGGFWIAVAMERWVLHRRIALHILRLVGDRPRRILLGFMLATGMLSMWLSNTATAMMMLPIGMAVAGRAAGPAEPNRECPPQEAFGTALMLGIAYAASIGGLATLIGTPPNAILAGMAETLLGARIGFGVWMAFGFPLATAMLLLTWWYLSRLAFPAGAWPAAGDDAFVEDEMRRLGPISREERLVLAVFVCVAAAWILRGVLDWAPLQRIGDAGIAVAGALSLFVLPASGGRGALLDWRHAVAIPWEVILLFGGGFALAAGFDSSGLALWIGRQLAFVQDMPPWLLILLVALLGTFLTEVTSNTATASMLLPIAASLATAAGMAPLALMTAAALAGSCAFMLPVATPPNAIVYASGRVGIPQMARIGFWLNLLGVLLIGAAVSWWLPGFGGP